MERKILKKPYICFPDQQKWPLNSPAKDTGRKPRSRAQACTSQSGACVLRGERAKASTTGKKVNGRNWEPAAGGQNLGRNPRCRLRGEGAGKGEPGGSRRRREGSQTLPRNRGGRVKLILTQFRNCAAPAGRPAESAGALGTRRRPKLGGRPAPVPAAPPVAPPSAALGGPRAPHWREALAPGAPSPRTFRPVLGECGHPRWVCRGVLARGRPLHRS